MGGLLFAYKGSSDCCGRRTVQAGGGGGGGSGAGAAGSREPREVRKGIDW